jgi:hypothetical protein
MLLLRSQEEVTYDEGRFTFGGLCAAHPKSHRELAWIGLKRERPCLDEWTTARHGRSSTTSSRREARLCCAWTRASSTLGLDYYAHCQWHFARAARGTPAAQLPAYRLREPTRTWLAGYAPQLSAWTWSEPAAGETVETGIPGNAEYRPLRIRQPV